MLKFIRPSHPTRFSYGLPLFLAAALTLVYGLVLHTRPVNANKVYEQGAATSGNSVEILRDPEILPEPARRIRHAILVAAMTGDIHSMRIPIEMNEIPPIFASEKISDPIEHWRSISGDAEGREILSILIKLFRTGFVRQLQESGDAMYVWPYFVNIPTTELTPAQQVELLTIVSPERFKAMQETGVYDYYRIGIAHDGTWHYFIDKDY